LVQIKPSQPKILSLQQFRYTPQHFELTLFFLWLWPSTRQIINRADSFRVARRLGAVLQLTESAIASYPLNLVFALNEPFHGLIKDLVDVRIGE